MSRFTRAVPFSIEPRRHGYSSSPTRNRTRNFWLEARDDFRFTIEPFCKQAEGEGVEPSRHTVYARPASNRLPSPVGLPFLKWQVITPAAVDLIGVEPTAPIKRRSVAPNGMQARQVVPAGVEPAVSCMSSRRPAIGLRDDRVAGLGIDPSRPAL